jgi:hypothetical protein
MITAKQKRQYLRRLTGKEGCNFRTVKSAAQWTCWGGNDKRLSRRILKAMGISRKDIKDFLDDLHNHGGHCDCEIVLNCTEYLSE